MSSVIPGQYFGHWRVMERFPADPSWWVCRCDCEGAVDELVHEEDLTGGESAECGDCEAACRIADLRGQRCGRWTVVARSYLDSARNWRWLVVCECGYIGRVRSYDLRTGKSRSCQGCALRARKQQAVNSS